MGKPIASFERQKNLTIWYETNCFKLSNKLKLSFHEKHFIPLFLKLTTFRKRKFKRKKKLFTTKTKVNNVSKALQMSEFLK